MLQIKKRHSAPRLPGFLQRHGGFLLFLLCMALIGFLAQVQWIGYVVIALFAVLSYVKHLPSQVTFLLALLTLGVVPIAIILSNWLVAQNFAAYSFVLFILGVVGLVMEIQKEPRSNVI